MKILKILLVDDDCKILENIIFNDYLLQDKVQASFAKDEKECLEALKTESFDWILMDGNLRDEVKGADIVSRLRDSGVMTPICMLSSSKYSNADGVKAGANTSLNKGEVMLNPEKLILHLQSVSV